MTKCHFQCTPCWVCRSTGVFRRTKTERRIRRHVVLAPNLRSGDRSAVRPAVGIEFLKKKNMKIEKSLNYLTIFFFRNFISCKITVWGSERPIKLISPPSIQFIIQNNPKFSRTYNLDNLKYDNRG